MAKKKDNFKDYADFLLKVGMTQLNGVDVTHDGYPLSAKESKFISLFIANGNVQKSLREAGLTMRSIAGKDYITDEITYRLDLLKKESIADADEIMQYFTSVMRGEVKDQFGLDAPLGERTAAARELAKRIVDIEDDVDTSVPEIKVTLNWEGVPRKDA
jgi:phage terminase small subunit